ncbi:MAG: DNA mismatch repair protein MutS [Leptospiraceae bacterium]|nr:DNA mismatch repair protein MutS [Leptospiraceae bacterium]
MGKAEKSRVRKKNNDPLDTPVMRQYLEMKGQYPDCILLFRMGDFYELFLEDAERAAPLMDVALTRRQQEIPMAGVPYHSADTYIARLLNAGVKVAIAEQETDPHNPKLMRRSVRRIITPGTVIEESLLGGVAHNYLMAVRPDGDCIGLALADISTGDFFCTQADAETDAGLLDAKQNAEHDAELSEPFTRALRDFFFKYNPREILVPSDAVGAVDLVLGNMPAAPTITPMELWKASPTEGKRRLQTVFGQNLSGLGYEQEHAAAVAAVSLILHYVERNFPAHQGSMQLQPPVFRPLQGTNMSLDEDTIRNLELLENQQEGGRKRSLFGILDECRTAPGKRFLREAVLTPLLNRDEILRRQNMIGMLAEDSTLRQSLTRGLSAVHDLERILSRMSAGRAAPRDFRAVSVTIRSAEDLVRNLAGTKPKNAAHRDANLNALLSIPSALQTLAEQIENTVTEEPPATLGGQAFIKAGVNAELDKAREAHTGGTRWMAEFESRERERTGIPTLRVKYNRVAGYFIEISKGQLGRVPGEYRRKQTLTGYERYSCEELDELQSSVLVAGETIDRLEQELFRQLTDAVLGKRQSIKTLMQGIGQLDFLLALALPVVRDGWCAPEIVEAACMQVGASRHPVVERFLNVGEQFIPNDIQLIAPERTFAIITGPNMAGKSTYIRQVALVQLLAQMGSFVPATQARLSIVDRIFTRIGAQDNLTRGESTFFVEMLETARILNQCTDQSLVIMDEVGRGTSTYDGMSLAWAIVEYLSGDGRARPLTLFATHYHELTALGERDVVHNLTMDVREIEQKVIFMHRVIEGAADRSYGIHVAQLAGLPREVIDRAQEKLQELEADDDRRKTDVMDRQRNRRKKSRSDESQKLLFGDHPELN